MPIPELGTAAARAREGTRKQQDAPAEPLPVTTAFLVCVTSDGRFILDTNIDTPVIPDRNPTRQEVIAACTNIIADLNRQAAVEETTMNVLGNFSRMQADPQYQAMLAAARTQAEAAATVANQAVRNHG